MSQAEPNEYTLLLIGPANAINISLYKELSFDFKRDITPVAGITREALVMVVHPSVPATTVSEFLDHAKSNPVDLKVASTGNGSSPHVTAVLFNSRAGLDLPLEHFKGGGPALKDIIAGNNTKIMFEPMSASIDPVKSGKLRALAVTTTSPHPPCRTYPPLPLLCRVSRQARSPVSAFRAELPERSSTS